jgi:hypothetical protein
MLIYCIRLRQNMCLRDGAVPSVKIKFCKRLIYDVRMGRLQKIVQRRHLKRIVKNRDVFRGTANGYEAYAQP